MKTVRYPGFPILTLVLLLALTGRALAANYVIPPGAPSWLQVEGSPCTDANGDDCIGGVGSISGTYGSPPTISVNATADANAMHGLFTETSTLGIFLYMSMYDTYTLHSNTLPVGTMVPITVSFHLVGTLQPLPWGCCGVFGGGFLTIRISDSWNGDPGVAPETGRVGSERTPSARKDLPNQQVVHSTSAAIPVDLPATWTVNEPIGTPFVLAYQLQTTLYASSLDFSHTASIGFELPQGTTITSANGYGSVTAVKGDTWGRLKQRYR